MRVSRVIMWKRVFIVLCILISVKSDLDVLTKNFFDNLEKDPKLLADYELNQDSKAFIDRQIENYINLHKIQQNSNGNKKKRSLAEFTGAYSLNAITPILSIPATFPTDLQLFKQNNEWFAAALESTKIGKTADSLAIFQHTNNSFTEIARVSIVNGAKLALINIEDFTLIAVGENDTSRDDFHKKSAIYQIKNNNLTRIQSLNLHYANDIVMWQIHDEILMAVAHFMANQTKMLSYEVTSRVYKWRGNHFDWVQSIPTKGARKITPFSIGGGDFLAIANSQNDQGDSKVYSEIYKYDHHSEKYELYQRILTRGCSDIKFFSFPTTKDYFLIVANTFERDTQNNVNYETNSILYKFVDDYFIPFQSFQLNAVEQWLPLNGPNQQFLLFAVCKFDGIKVFQYDDWRFVENFNVNNRFLQGSGVKSIYPTNFNDGNISITNKNNNGQYPNLYSLEFVHSNSLDAIHSELMTWCKNSMDNIAPKDSDNFFADILEKAQRADVTESSLATEETTVDFAEIEIMNAKLDALNLVLDGLQSQIQNPPPITENITAEEIIFNNNVVFSNLNTPKINSFDINNILENSLDITEGFQLPEITLDTLQTENKNFEPEKINGKNANSLLYQNSDLVLDRLRINGDLFVPNGINVEGKVNGINVNDQNLLFSIGDQTVLQPMVHFEDIRVNNLTAKSLNGVNLSTLQQIREDEDQILVDHITNLTVRNLFVGGYINDVDVDVLDKYALKKSGNQIITKTYTFDAISAEDLQVHGLISGKNLENLIGLDGQSVVINQEMPFSTPPEINNLTILDSLNGIKVINNKLDVLLTDTTEKQIITGLKDFENMIIYQPVDLRTRITSEKLNKFNPVVSVDEEIILEKNLTITGNVKIEKFLKAGDILSRTNFSAVNLNRNGLKLTEKEIHPRLRFTQQLNVDEIFVEKINDIEPENFVVNGGNEDQRIYGTKIFNGNLHVAGPTIVQAINGVNLAELDGNVLRVNGNQTVFATHRYKQVLAKNISVSNIDIENNLVELNEIVSDTVTLNSDVDAIFVKTNNITVEGDINNVNFNEMVKDTVKKDTKTIITGTKTVKTLQIDDVTIENGFSLNGIASILENGINEMELDGPIEIHKPIAIENLHFEQTFNGVNKSSFGAIDTDENGNQLVYGDRYFEKIVVFKEVFIDSNRINNVGINDLVHNSVKTDEPFEFNSANFKSNVISANPVVLHGQIENVDLDNIVLSHSDFPQIVFDEKTFTNNVTVNGNINFNGLINRFNVTDFCYLMEPSTQPKNITIEGNVYFTKGPKVVNINQVKVDDIAKNAWFDDQNANLEGYFQFNDVVFSENVNVGGFVDNISLSLINENYFSKSKNQTIPATFNFEADINFENNVTTNEMILNDNVNNVYLDEFIRTVLLDQIDQVFETVLYLETCEFNELNGEFTVNNLDLENDVMRYDKTNMVTGTKSFRNLNINLLKTEKNINIQNVDVLDWFKYTALKTSSCNVTGTKIFNNVVFANGIGINGNLNHLKFDVDNIMVKNVPQQITGKKTFITNPIDPAKFKSIKLKGLLNNISMSDLINNQAYKNQDNVFKNPLLFNNNITTNNLIIYKNYQGINMTDLISNVTNLGALNNLLDNFRKLEEMSDYLKESLKHQAYYVHHYKVIQTIGNVRKSFTINNPDGTKIIGAVVSSGPNHQLQMLKWKAEQNAFVLDYTINLQSENVDYVDQALMGRYMYIEEENHGRFVNVQQTEHSFSLKTNKTRAITSFHIPYSGENCILFIYHNCIPKIFCERNEQLVLMQEFNTYDEFKDAKSLLINDVPFLFTINGPANESETQINIWKLNKLANKFELYQSVFAAEAASLAVINYNNMYYLAIAYDHLQNAKYSGKIEISQLDYNSQQFVLWQNIELDAPLQIEFSVLSSYELVLYVVTDNPTKPFIVYNYAGVSKFRQTVIGSTLPNIQYINQFMGETDSDFIIAQSYDEINVIQAIFKGERVLDG